jgi:hypothetical protein
VRPAETVIRDPDEMVDIVVYRTPEGRNLLTVRTTALNARWVRALFAHSPEPFKLLRDIGFKAVG